jgi:DHA2 family multidrug resistance protein-like MFS transporter
MMPPMLSLITATFTETAERQRATGMWAATTGLGAALGPIIGGLLLRGSSLSTNPLAPAHRAS